MNKVTNRVIGLHLVVLFDVPVNFLIQFVKNAVGVFPICAYHTIALKHGTNCCHLECIWVSELKAHNLHSLKILCIFFFSKI